MRGLAVAAGAAHLLVVRLDRARRSQVDHRADVRPIDAHAERVGRDDDLGPALGEVAPARARACRRRGRRDRRAPASRGRRAARASSSACLRVGAYTMAVPAARPGPPSASASAASTRRSRSRAPVDLRGAQDQVGPREAADDLRACRRARPSRARISSRTTGVAVAVHASTRAAPSSARSAADAEVLRPEIVAPLADAVRLVDGDQRALEVAQEARGSRRKARRSGAT